MNPGDHQDDKRITYFAATRTRGKREMFGIRAIDRGKHMYVIGKTGMGKSTMLENMAIQDIQNGEGLAFIDPHGSTAEKLLDFVPYDRIKDVVYFAPFDTDHPMGFNVMEDVGYDKRHLVVSGLMGALKRIWVDAWSARMEYILQNTLLALLEYPGSTLLDVNRMLTNKDFRKAVVEKIQDPIVKAFWTQEFAGFTDKYAAEATPAIQNKIGQFVSNPLIRNICGQAQSSFDLRKIMDEKKIFIVNLSKGRMGETNASLLGSMLTVKIYLAAMSRADEPASRMQKLPRFYFFVDEFQSMMNEAFADILSEARKYKLALTLANQYVEQMEENVRNAVFGNVGTMITFRVGPFDAETLKTIYEPVFMPEDLVNLGIGEIYLTLMIDGVGSPPFSAQTIPPIEAPDISYREDVVNASRAQFGRPRAEVESYIKQRQEEFVMPPVEKKPRYDANGNAMTSGPRTGGGPGGFRPGGPSGGQNGGQNSGQHRDASGFAPRPYAPAPVRSPREVLSTSRDTAPRPGAPSWQRPPRAEGPGAVPPPRPRPTMPPPRAEERPEPQERNALRDAIQAARVRPDVPAAGGTAAAPVAPTRSPAELLRERAVRPSVSSAPARPAEPAPQPVRPSDVRRPSESAVPEPKLAHVQQDDQHQRRAQQQRTERASWSASDESRESDEVSPETLARILRDEGAQ